MLIAILEEQRCGGQELRSGSSGVDDSSVEDRGYSGIPSLYAESGEECEAAIGIARMGHSAFYRYHYSQTTGDSSPSHSRVID